MIASQVNWWQAIGNINVTLGLIRWDDSSSPAFRSHGSLSRAEYGVCSMMQQRRRRRCFQQVLCDQFDAHENDLKWPPRRLATRCQLWRWGGRGGAGGNKWSRTPLFSIQSLGQTVALFSFFFKLFGSMQKNISDLLARIIRISFERTRREKENLICTKQVGDYHKKPAERSMMDRSAAANWVTKNGNGRTKLKSTPSIFVLFSFDEVSWFDGRKTCGISSYHNGIFSCGSA